MSCNVEQYYWLSWHEGHIALGRGKERSKGTIIAYQDLVSPPIAHVPTG